MEAMEKKLEQNRSHMQKEAKKAAKIEKKIRTLTWGYQDIAQKEMKKMLETVEEIEEHSLRKSTFEFLRNMETVAIPNRIDALQADVNRQKEREKILQERFRELSLQLEKSQETNEVETTT